MPAAYVQSKFPEWSGQLTGVGNAFTSNVVAGNKVVVFAVSSYLGCPPSIADSQSNTYTSHGTQPNPAPGGFFYVFSAPIGSSGALTVTPTFACGYLHIYLQVEVSGLQTSAYDVENVLSDSTSPCNTGSITTTQDGDYIIAAYHRNGVGNSYTAGTGFTLRDTTSINGWEDQVQATAGSITPDITCTASAAYPVYGFAAAFKAVPAAGGSTLPYFGADHSPYRKITRVVSY